MKLAACLATGLLFLGFPALHAQTFELLSHQSKWDLPPMTTYWISNDIRGGDLQAVGSGNWHAEAGEAFDLYPSLRNAGPDDIGSLIATASIGGDAAQWARVIRASADFGRVKGGEKVGKQRFRIEALESAPAPCTLSVEVSLVADGKPANPPTFTIEVYIDRVIVLPLEFVAPEALEAGKKSLVRLALTAPVPEASYIYVFLSPQDFDVRIEPPSLNLLRSDELTFEPCPYPTSPSATIGFRVSIGRDAGGPSYEYRPTLTLPVRPSGPQATLDLAGAPGLDPTSVFVDHFGYPVLVPGVPRPAGVFQCPLQIPRKAFAVRVEPHGPPGVAPPAFAVAAGAWPGTPIVSGSSWTPDDRPLSFGWTGAPPSDWSVWVRVRPEAIVFELHHAPPAMLHVPAGSFEFDRGGSGTRHANEGRTVRLSAFCLDAFEVTRGRYAAFLADPKSRSHELCDPAEGPSKEHTPLGWNAAALDAERGFPVVGVDWFDAAAFARWAGKRLPTAAEWERVAKGPHQRAFPWGDDHYCGVSILNGSNPGPLRVGRAYTDRSEEGAYDMGGNVAEWVSDWRAANEFTDADRDPHGPPTGAEKLQRGSSFKRSVSAAGCTSSRRAAPNLREADFGFRCARDAER